MTQAQSEANDILAYALQRRSIITQACELVQSLGLPVDRAPLEPDVPLRALAYNWAVNVHPDLMRWYRDAAQATQFKCRYLRIEQGVEEVGGIERLVLRDLNLFTTATDAHLALPDEMRKRIIDVAEPVHANTAVVGPLRLATVLPGMLLLAWDQAWRDAIESFGQHVGDVIQTPAAVEGFHSRIDDLEESVQLMLNRFVALSAAAEIPSDYRRG